MRRSAVRFRSRAQGSLPWASPCLEAATWQPRRPRRPSPDGTDRHQRRHLTPLVLDHGASCRSTPTPRAGTRRRLGAAESPAQIRHRPRDLHQGDRQIASWMRGKAPTAETKGASASSTLMGDRSRCASNNSTGTGWSHMGKRQPEKATTSIQASARHGGIRSSRRQDRAAVLGLAHNRADHRLRRFRTVRRREPDRA
jgi:hypothetical protein